ncbi:MAG: 16S rRNA (cytosine(1402)-N(4))-methyltransferase RsmH [Rhodospirillales bacterium]|nr:16S rRNA (cytosine(1402)-N(4))-methyltransferase RsmH [Alphaproteobacteria bacterium]MCB9981892.1 16S rRNA (cytosine(1402)-N(4))-methyltransferase RsmH [Rhodospirillales bacterium]
MLNEVLSVLSPVDGGVYVDGTFGAGGYARAILDAADCTVVAIDRDPDAAKRADNLSKDYAGRLIFLRGCFGDVENLLAEAGIGKVDGFVLDLGVSSFQLDQAERGFSFRETGPLDMRMDPESGPSAADLVNSADEKELADLIYKYGEERKSRQIARRIVELRRAAPIETTGQLADIIRSCVPKSRDGIDPATRTFQALRIAVNDELGELERALDAAEKILKPHGKMVVVSFHSLEDGLVKRFFRAQSGGESVSRYLPQTDTAPVKFKLLTRKAVKPAAQEITENSRSRSARLRAAEYIGGAL